VKPISSLDLLLQNQINADTYPDFSASDIGLPFFANINCLQTQQKRSEGNLHDLLLYILFNLGHFLIPDVLNQ
jgi:hypothetical protein